MRKTTWIVASTCGLFLLAGIPGQSASAKAADSAKASASKTASTKPAAKSPIVAVYGLRGPIEDGPEGLQFGFELEPQQSLFRLLQRFRKVEKDDSVKAVVLTFSDVSLGWGKMQELRQAILGLRAAKKDVYCYLEEATPTTYLLATAASRICIVPTGDIALMGMHVEQAYFKNLMDKIGLAADIEHVGAYKGAGEPFTRTGPSDEARQMMEWLVKDLYEQMLETVSQGRDIPADQVRALIDRGPFNARQALEARLVDETMYADELVESIRERYGENADFVANYGKDKKPQIDFSSPFAFFKLLGEGMSKGKASAKPAVAVVYLDGMIVTGKTEQSPFGDAGAVGSTSPAARTDQGRQGRQCQSGGLPRQLARRLGYRQRHHLAGRHGAGQGETVRRLHGRYRGQRRLLRLGRGQGDLRQPRYDHRLDRRRWRQADHQGSLGLDRSQLPRNHDGQERRPLQHQPPI
jgi:ClpP class serine protease